MIIAIDYDLTYTADPDFWDSVIANGRARGHSFICVTNRSTPPNTFKSERIPFPSIKFICAGPDLMKDDAARQAGYIVNVWIDDVPNSVR